MLSPVRWRAEQEMMRRAGLGLEPFISDRHFGFTGKLPGRSGRPYDVEIRADRQRYPAKAPKVYIHPRVGGNYLLDGSLCVIRAWHPAKDTLAQQALYAATYLFEKG